jgi:hypothetical protein
MAKTKTKTKTSAAFSITLGVAAALAVVTAPREARAFRGCEDIRDNDQQLFHCWPAYTGADRPPGQKPAGNGTERWSFCYKVDNQGLELHDVTYDNLTVAKKISLAYLLTSQPATGTPSACGGGQAVAADNTPNQTQVNNAASDMGCVHVPSTVCNVPTRACVGGQCVNTPSSPMSCTADADCAAVPSTGALDPADCDGSGLCVSCRGVCAGSQNNTKVPPGVEMGVTEENAGGGDADLVLTMTTYDGGHQVLERYRFKHDGRLMPSVLFGGSSALQQHSHAVYWRFELDMPGATAGNDIIQRCATASCGATDTVAAWGAPRGCECADAPAGAGLWRVYDTSAVTGGSLLRSLVIAGGSNDGTPNVCGATDKRYCALRTDATGMNEGLTPNPDACTDGLNDYAADTTACGDITGGAPLSFWYVAHASHDPCDVARQGYCAPNPTNGEEALGPTLTLAGDWTGQQCQLVGVLTQRNDNRRTGANLGETTLNTGNVAGLHRLFDLPVEGQLMAQPLVTSVTGAGCAARNVIYVGTMANRVYMFDADSGVQLAATGQLDGPPYRMADAGSGGGIANPFFGITSTPVIDPDRSILFLVTKTDDQTLDGAGHHVASFHLHALNALTLEDLPGSPTTLGTIGNIQNVTCAPNCPGTVSTFIPNIQNNRPGLLLDHGHLYLGFGALPFDDADFHGFLLTYSYDGSQFTQTAAVGMSQQAGAGIWQAGSGLIADAAGNVFFETGNIKTNAKSSGPDLGEAALKIAPGGGSLLSTFLPGDSDLLNAEDLDLGASGPLLMSSAAGDRLLVLGKQGIITLHDTADLTHEISGQRFRATFNQYFQLPCLGGKCPTGTVCEPPSCCNNGQCSGTTCTSPTCPHDTGARGYYPHEHATPVLWEYALTGGGTETRVYTWGEKDILRGHLFDKAMGLFPTASIADDGTYYPTGLGCPDPTPSIFGGCLTIADEPIASQVVSPARGANGVPGVGQNGLSHLGPHGMPGGSMSLSANQMDPATGILWVSTDVIASSQFDDSEGQFVRGVLRAYQASPTPGTPPTLTELWNNFPEAPYYMGKFAPPTVFNGRVYLDTNQIINLPNPPPTDPNAQIDPGNPTGSPTKAFTPYCVHTDAASCGGAPPCRIFCGSGWTTDPLQVQGHLLIYGL